MVFALHRHLSGTGFTVSRRMAVGTAALPAKADDGVPDPSLNPIAHRAAFAASAMLGPGRAMVRRWFDRYRLCPVGGFRVARDAGMADLVVGALVPRPDMLAEAQTGRAVQAAHADVQRLAADLPPEQLRAAFTAKSALGALGGSVPV